MAYFRERSGGGSFFAWLGGFAVGALVMYVFDPEKGRRRRAVARDKAIHAAHVASDTLNATSLDLANRARGVVAETRSAMAQPPISSSGASEPAAGGDVAGG